MMSERVSFFKPLKILPTETTHKLRILLLEDHRPDALLFERILKKTKEGDRYEVFTVKTLIEALAALKHRSFDIVVTDLSLPDSQGINAVEEIRKAHPTIAMVVLSGTKDDEVSVASMHSGAQDYLLKDSLNAESLRRSLKFAIERQRTQIEARVERNILDPHPDRDYLTSLPDSLAFRSDVEQAVRLAKRSGKPTGLLMVEIIGFNEIINAFGTSTGNVLLLQITERLKSLIRESDLLGRISFSRFAICLQQVDPGTFRCLTSRLLSKLQDSFFVDEQKLSINVAVGAGLYPEDTQSAHELIETTISALTRASKHGETNIQFASPRMNMQERVLNAKAKALEEAFYENRLEVSFRTFVDMQSTYSVGLKPQLTWKTEDFGEFGIDDMSAIGASQQLTRQINQHLVHQGLIAIQRWKESGHLLDLHLQLSPSIFRDEEFIRWLPSAIAHFQLLTNQVWIELPESHFLTSQFNGLRPLRESGFRFLMSRFGSELSSTSVLKCFPFNGVKFKNGLFSHGLSEGMQHLLRGWIAYAKQLEIFTIRPALGLQDSPIELNDFKFDWAEIHSHDASNTQTRRETNELFSS